MGPFIWLFTGLAVGLFWGLAHTSLRTRIGLGVIVALGVAGGELGGFLTAVLLVFQFNSNVNAFLNLVFLDWVAVAGSVLGALVLIFASSFIPSRAHNTA